MLQLDKKFLAELEKSGVSKLKVFFYDAGCSGKKLGVETEFEVTDDLEISELGTGTLVPVPNIQLYVPQQDAEYFRNAKLTRIVKSDHTGKQKIRYIFTSSEVQDRCGCGTSFAFEKPKPKINIEKLKNLKHTFNS